VRLTLASYRLRIPLSLSLAALVTALFMGLAIGIQTLANVRDDQDRNVLSLAYAMADVQIQALRNEDVWLAYSLLRGPKGGTGDVIWILTDDRGRIFASNQPHRYRLDQPLHEALPWLPPSAPINHDIMTGQVASLDHQQKRRLLRLPLHSQGAQVGELIALLSDAPFFSRFREIIRGGVLATALVLAILLPLGWFLGQRMVAPLSRLADCMALVGQKDPRQLRCVLADNDSEIGQLSRRFRDMLAGLAEQEALKGQMIQAERLAAVGRVAAGVAHEVNNPLGGMRMAIDTFRQTQSVLGPVASLLDLLERALVQIQSSISALLVEARPDLRPLSPADLDDARTLAQPILHQSGIHLTWENGLSLTTGLPATPVRQLLLNLLLNAAKASGQGGQVSVQIGVDADHLVIRVENSGEPFPAHQLARLFEPYPAHAVQERGLGLWVCYQIVTHLGGVITADSAAGLTRIQAALPLQGAGRP